MTTTAKKTSPSSSSADVRRSSSSSSSPSNLEVAEDIEYIAKQISDHAEAIYQEWKARGLAPSEILKCNPDSDKNFNKTLNATSSSTSSTQQCLKSLNEKSFSSPEKLFTNDKSLSNNNSNLNQLVNSFVNEDKARIAAAAQRTDDLCVYTHIKYKINSQTDNVAINSESPLTTVLSDSHNHKNKNTTHNPEINEKTLETISQNDKCYNYQVPDVLKDTIEKCAKLQKPATPAKPEYLLNHVPSWPFKNRSMKHNNEKKIIGASSLSSVCSTISSSATTSPSSSSDFVDCLSKQKTINNIMDEVSREEEKLINALKTGTILKNCENDSLPEPVASSLNECKFQSELQFNGISTIIKENKRIENKHENQTRVADQNSLQIQSQLPQKPNHTPIYVSPIKDEILKGFSSFTRVATTRIPNNRHDLLKLDEKKFELKSIPSPVRPFLSRGSVAERVLIFEKCPEKTTIRQNTEKPKIQVTKVDFLKNSLN